MLINDRIQFCCQEFGKLKVLEIPINGASEEEIYQLYIKERDNIIEALNTSSGRTTVTPCHSCRYTREGYWPVNRRLSIVNIDVPSICQFKCCYCAMGFKTTMDNEGLESGRRMLSFFKYLENIGAIDPQKIKKIGFASGEITIHPLRNEILSAYREYKVTIMTNAHIYNEQIDEMLKSGRCMLLVSIDAGTPETFAYVKGIDCINTVRENLKRYAASGIVDLKYIILPGVNDNAADITGFAELCAEVGARNAVLSRDSVNMKKFDDNIEQILPMIDLFVSEMNKRAIKAVIPEYVRLDALKEKR